MGRSLSYLLCLVSCLHTCSGDSWLIGCRYGNWNTETSPALTRKDCFNHCLETGSRWAGWREPEECRCQRTVEEEELTEPEVDLECSQSGGTRCSDDPLAGKAWSVYLVDGPKLGPAVLEIRPGPTYAGEGLTVKVQLEVTGTEKGVRLRLFVTWEMDERCSAREIVEVTEKGLSGLAWTAKIPSPGTHVIGVVVDAGEGVVSARRRVTVSPPIPSGLKVTLHPEVKETPTCVPSHLPPGHVTVYTGRKARLVASVETGCDPTFSWRVDEEDPWESGPFPGGSGLSLRRSVLEHTFGREGVHRVSVNVSNLHGWVHRSISVVAVDYRMSDAVLRSRNGHRHPSDSRVTFLLTVFTTHHVATRLLLRPGDGTQLRHTLQVGADDRDVSVRHDRRCRLSAEIHHTYNEEGEFHPLALVDDGTVRIEARTSRVLKVCHRLDHGTLSGKGVIPTGSSLKLALHLNTRSLCDIRVDWRLLESNRTVLFSKNRKIEWSPRIRRAGTYTVVSTAKNPVGNVTFRHEVKVQDPVRRLSIRGIGSYYPTGIPFRLVAVIGGGSHVTCGWSTGSHSDWHKWEGHGGCRAIWTFYKAGNKKIELEAGNLVGRKKTGGRITVVEPIHGVYVSLEDPASSKRPLRIEVLVLKGSHLNVTFDGGMVTRVGRGRFLLTGSEPSPGRHILDLVLSNPVGEHRTRVEMRTRSPLSEDLRPTILLQSAYRDSATYRVDFSGSSTEKLLYRWKAPCCQPLYTSLPIVDWKWTRHVQLTVVNAISSVTVEAAIPEPETRIPTLLHSSVVEVGRPINFSLQNLEPDPYRRIDVTYSGDGWTDERTFSSNAGPESWTHIFHRAGWVDIRVTQFSDRLWISNFTLSSRLNVQYPLGKIHVLGPRLVPYLDRFAILGCWRAAISPESDIGVVYAWKVEDEWKITAESEVSLSLSRPGSHVIEVKAWNGVSRLATLLTVIAVPVVTEVSLRVLPVHVGRVSEFRISYVGSSSCNVSVSFGDGSWRTIYYFRSDRSQPGLFTLPVLHKYGRKGDYPVVVNVSNQISWMTTRRMAHVGELISGVILTLLTPSPVPLTVDVGLVVVRATVASGTDLKFKWEFRDNDGDKYTSVESNETVSVARHGYGIAETYNVSVEVSNPFGKVVAYLDAPVRVVEPIRQLRLRPVGDIWAAPLLVGGSEPPITPPVTFEAQVYWGSDVEFLFDFGDGNGTSVPAQLGTLSLRPTAQCTHYYRREKAYTVKVTASNPLGSVSMTLPDLFYVQIPPKGLELNRKYYITVLGEPIVLGATVTAGTNVSYDWYLGDNIVYSKRGPEIVLNFDKIGKYNVTVQAYNKVTNLSPNIDHLFASTNVYVQEPLQGVEICIMIKEEIICEGNNVSLPSDEEVTMVAHVLPSDETALKFLWDLGLGELRKTNSPSLRYNYREPGIYVANITALNHVSMVLSGQIVIHVVQKVGNLTSIRHSGSILVNRTTIFHAQYWFGTNLTFEWDFGDGTKKLITSSDKVQHTYTSVGEYWMTVIAHNKYSRASLKTNVFVLYQFCQKPQIKFIDQTIEKKIQYNHDVMLEVDLTTSCELSNDVLYFWKVFDERQKEMNFSEEIMTQRQLIISKEILPIGKYIIELKVQMNRTMVYAIETTEITIVPSNIIAIWEGGILRQVGFEDDITLNIISNVNLEETNCSLNWYCTSFPFNHQQCFKNGSSSGTITRFFPSINFHVGLLNLKLSAVSFKLNIYHDRKLQASTLQELEITEKSHMLPILIKRYNHFSHVVRQDTRLIFLAICKGCRDVKLEFQWKLWLVQDGNHNLYISEHNCVQADGSTFFIHADNITTAKPMNPTGHWTLESTNSKEDNLEEEFPPFPKFPGLPEVKKWQSFVENTDRKKRETFQQTGDDFEEKDEATNPPFFPFPPVEGDVTYEASHLHLPEEFAAQELISDSFYPFEEGNPGEGGSAFAREHNLQQLEKSEEKILEEIGKGRYGTIKNNQNDDDYNGEFNLPDDIGHAAVDGRYPSTAPHVIRRPRIPLSSESNLVSPEYFILEPRSLKIGSTYIVEATVTSKDNPELMGKAMDYVIVNIGPTNGRCTLIPLEGREFATWFRLHCMEWRTEYHPLWYELHYTQIPNATGHLVYVGLNGNAKFTLPAGLPEYNHNVYVDIVVRDGSGSGTRVCSIVRKVYPEWEDSEDLKLFIVNETTSSQSSFNKMLGEKNYQGLLHQIHIWVTGLNRVDANFTKRKRRETNRDNLRQELINLIGSLKLNTLAEAHQALQALLPLLDAPSQILVKDLTTSFELIQKFNERKSLHINFPVKTFQESLLRVTSQIIYLSSILLEDAELAKDITLKSLLEKSIIIMRNAIKKNASSLIPNDRPYVFETSHVVFFYSRIATDNPEPIIKFGENEIILGRQMYLDLFNVSDRDNLLSCRKSYPFICDCVEIMAESFANGLYVNGNNWINTGISSKWNGGISSVNFHSCDVQDHVHVTNPNVEFHLKRLKMNLGKEYTLSKDNIHIHQLNLTKDQVNKSLIISLDIQDFEKKHLFPLCLLFSSKQPPQPTKYMKKVSSKHHEKTMKLFIPNYLVKEPGLYYLTVLDGHFSKHSRQNIDFSPITYTLQIWLEQCVSWDGHRQHWSSDRCIVLETTNIDSVHCSCKSIGPTSYYTWNLATNLEIASVDKFLSSMIHLLPVIFIIFTYVLILIICHFYGAHDRKRAPLIDLKDNSHKYGYLMIIETGFYWNAGTTAMVCVVLHGENGMSETTSLVNRDSNHALFRRGSINTFYISTQSNLGNLWKLQIWHNNGGASPSWFLKNIMVFDMHTGKSYYFECEQWLSVEEEDGQIEKELPLNEISWNLSKVYRETFIHYLCDYHLWSSVCLKPPYSSFSRAQRLTCCFSLIVSSAALIAVWYKYQHFQYYVEYGLPDSSWQTLAVGIISGLFVMVPHQFISALFRNSQASQMTLFKYFRPICSDWSWKSLYCSYQQKEANSTEASSESFSTSNSRSIYTADSLSHFEESLDSDDDSSREQFLLMDGNNADLYNLYNKNQYRRHSWDSYDDIGNSIEEELYNSYKKREYQSEANERIKSARRKEMNCSEQTSSGFEDWPDKTVEDANYEEFYHPGTIPLPLLSRMQKIVLPCWVQTVAWIFLLTIASFSTYITMSYVYRFGDHYFNCWLQSLFYNILASVFLLHPLWISLLSIPVSIRTWLLGDKESFISLRVNVSLIEEIVRVDYQLKNSPEYFGGEEEKLMKRQRARYLRYLRPPPEQTLIEARRKALETKFVLKSIKSICLSLMTIVLLIVIAFGNDTNHYYRQNVSIQNAFLRASKNSFFNIRSHSAWWKWIQNDFLDGFYGVENSNGVLQQRTEFDSLLSTGCIPVGTVSIRQHRVTSQPCLELYHYFSSEKCFPSYSKHYGYIGSNKTLGFDNPWMDKSVWGRHGLYIGDGEAIILGKTRKAALDELERLQSKNWVNNSSRALIVEFLLYNPTLSLYIPVSILTEFTAVGSVEGSFSALPCRLYRYSTTADSVILASQFIFLILILWMVKEEVWKMWKIGHSYWLSPWKYLQASFCLLSLSYLSCHVYRSVLVTAAIQNQQFPVFVSHISEVAYWDQILNGQLGVLIFIYALSRLKLLNISVKTKQFLQVFKFIQKETLMAVLLSALLLVGFAHIGNLAFGSDEFNFKSPVFQAWRALRSTLRQSPVTRYPDSASYGAEVYAVVLLFGMLGWLALGMAMIKAVMMRSKRQIRPKREKGLEAGEAARLILRSLGMAKKERKDSQCREKSSPPAELLLMELETLVDDIFVYANKLFSDIDTHDDYIQLEEKVPVDVENSKECHRVVAELHHCSTENSLDKDEDRQCGYQSTNGSDNETVDSCQ